MAVILDCGDIRVSVMSDLVILGGVISDGGEISVGVISDCSDIRAGVMMCPWTGVTFNMTITSIIST